MLTATHDRQSLELQYGLNTYDRLIAYLFIVTWITVHPVSQDFMLCERIACER